MARRMAAVSSAPGVGRELAGHFCSNSSSLAADTLLPIRLLCSVPTCFAVALGSKLAILHVEYAAVGGDAVLIASIARIAPVCQRAVRGPPLPCLAPQLRVVAGTAAAARRGALRAGRAGGPRLRRPLLPTPALGQAAARGRRLLRSLQMCAGSEGCSEHDRWPAQARAGSAAAAQKTRLRSITSPVLKVQGLLGAGAGVAAEDRVEGVHAAGPLAEARLGHHAAAGAYMTVRGVAALYCVSPGRRLHCKARAAASMLLRRQLTPPHL